MEIVHNPISHLEFLQRLSFRAEWSTLRGVRSNVHEYTYTFDETFTAVPHPGDFCRDGDWMYRYRFNNGTGEWLPTEAIAWRCL